MPDTFLGLSGAATTPVTPSYGGQPGPGPAPNPWKVNGATVYYDEGGVTLPDNVIGGSKGKGTFNAQGVYENGVPVVGSGGPPAGPAGGDLEGFYPDPTFKTNIALAGNPTTTTQTTADTSDRLATTAFVKAVLGDWLPKSGGVLSGPLSVQTLTMEAQTGSTDEGGQIDWKTGTLATRNLSVDMFGNTQRAFSYLKPSGTQITLWTLNLDGSGYAVNSLLTATTPAAGANNTEVATTAWVAAKAYAPLDAPVFTGDARAPTPTLGDNDTSIATTAFVQAAMAAVGLAVPPGVITDFAGTTAPAGWLLCQGQTVSRSGANANLFAAIGTAYNTGGEAGTDFRIPDLRGRVIAGLDGGTGRLPTVANVVGSVGGAANVTLTVAQMALHAHGAGTFAAPDHLHGAGSITAPGHAHSITSGNSTPASYTSRAGQGDGGNVYDFGTSTNGPWGCYGSTGASDRGLGIGGTSANAGSDTAHSNTQPTMVMNKIIRL